MAGGAWSEQHMDRIHIDGLLLRCIIGTNEWEREKKQDVLIDIVLHADVLRAGHTDDLADTVNYRSIAKQVIDQVEASRYHLVEALAEHVARLCLADPRVAKVEVDVQKPGALRFARSVGVTIVRERDA
jgi:dihydroneopterin aldolase/D-erythro-7,8-dihydroneopterin triphosphate epimerase